jgi:hypothetical protein
LAASIVSATVPEIADVEAAGAGDVAPLAGAALCDAASDAVPGTASGVLLQPTTKVNAAETAIRDEVRRVTCGSRKQ